MDEQRSKMKWVLFWVFIAIYIIVTLLTILALFFDLGNLATDYKTPLFTTFIIETGVGIITLFYSLFGLSRNETKETTPQVNSEIINNVSVVDDSPLDTEIQLNKPVDLLGSYKGQINSILSSESFSEQYNPAMMMFTSTDEDYTEFRPSVVLQLLKNPLISLNTTLADYMDSSYTLTKEMQDIIGKRKIRIGTNIAIQWFRVKFSNILGIKVDSDTVCTQFQKFVVSNELMGIVTIAYGDDTKPKDIKILQDLLNEFGIKE